MRPRKGKQRCWQVLDTCRMWTLLSHLSLPDNLIFRRRQLRKCKGATAVQLLSADADLCPKSKFRSIGKTSRCVPVHRGRIDSTQKSACMRFISCDNGFGMLG